MAGILSPIGPAQIQPLPNVQGPRTGAPSARQREETGPDGLTEAERREVRELRDRDQEVRAHEQAHKNVAGPLAGPISYDTTTGPDGRQYAVGGSVDIDASPENDPEDTIAKMDIVIRAALAPAQPSSEDYAVARRAQQQRTQAQQELIQQQQEELQSGRNDNNPANAQRASDNLNNANTLGEEVFSAIIETAA